MKKILFTIQWYKIPSSIAASANAICDENIIEELCKNEKYEIHCLSYGVSEFISEEQIDGVHIHRIRRSSLWERFVLTRNGKISFQSRFIYMCYRILMRLKQFLFVPIYPIYEPFHTVNFAKKALELHEKEHFDIIISEFNGFDSLCAGAYVKSKNTEIVFIPICWDSISGGRLPHYLPKLYSLRQKRKLENVIMDLADKAIVMKSSRNFHDTHTMSYDYYKKFIFLDVPYLKKYDMKISMDTYCSKELTFLYAGTLTDRSPEYLFELLNELNMHISFTFICVVSFHSKLLQLSKKYKNIKIVCLPYMTHFELKMLQLKATCLVNFGVSNANAVSGKIFDYMSSLKPIISTVNHDNEACIPYLKKYPSALIIDERYSIKHNLVLMKKFLSNISSISISFQTVSELFRDNCPKTYIQEIEALLS